MHKRLLIGVITAECHVDFQAETLKGIISQAFKSNCDIAVISSFHNFYSESRHKEGEKEIFRLILSDRIDGFLYDRNTFYSENIRSFIDDLLERSGKPVMLLDSGGHKKFESTAIDDCSAFEEMTDHLIEVHGYRRIYCLTGPKKQFVSEERLNGYRRSMKKHGIPVEREYCIYGDFWVNEAKKLAAGIISGRLPRPEAVVCGNDHSAMSLTEALTEGGIRVPEDIAVTGYDDSEEGRRFTPSITSFRRPNFQLGAEAFRRLYRIITGKICTRVGNEHVSLRLGESCGCRFREPAAKVESRRRTMASRYMNDILNGDMLFDISSADTPERFGDRLDNYTYCIHKMRRLDVCLTGAFLENGETSGFSAASRMKPILRKTALSHVYDGYEYFRAAELHPDLSRPRPYPVAYFITPLHCNDRFFGYSTLSFGKEPISYDEVYVHWTSFVNSALDQLRVTCEMRRSMTTVRRKAHYDSRTELLNRCGIEDEFSAKQRGLSGILRVIRTHLKGIEKLYYSCGEDEYSRMAGEFGRMAAALVRDGEIFGLWEPNVYVLLTDLPDRENELYNGLCAAVEKERFGAAEGCSIAFSIGIHQRSGATAADLGSAVQKAAVNRIFSYTSADSGTDPQFERMCRLRERIAENPEQPWSIQEIADELYLSRSHMQRLYKTYFGRGIAEDKIAFRMKKAQELLTTTDMAVSEIARECGYSTYNYFVRQFREHFGMAPNSFRGKSASAEANEK